MAIEHLHSQYLSEDILIRYFKGESSDQEKKIVENLHSLDINLDNYNEMEKLIKEGEFDFDTNSENDYNKFIENYKAIPIPSSKKIQKITPLPRAGQIWSTKNIATLPDKEVAFAVMPRYVFIISDPEPFAFFDDEDYVNEFPDCYLIQVIPISLETLFAYDSDYIFLEGNELLTIPFSIETDLKCNMLVRNLEGFIGEPSFEQKEAILNVFLYSNNLPYDKEIFKRASKGTRFTGLYGDKYDFKIVERDSLNYLIKPVEMLYDFFTKQKETDKFGDEVTPWFAGRSEYKYALAAKDMDFNDPCKQNSLASVLLFKSDSFEIDLVALESKRIYLRIIHTLDDYKNHKADIFLKEYNSDNIVWEKKAYQFIYVIDYIPIEILFNNPHLEFTFVLDDKLLFTETIKFRNAGNDQ
ncbi:MAG: hypothetical protein M0P71_08020 [Melioribacteraceae bacterium]|nr:hypothetical protein [Melioribacteraceae bacterium]